MATEGTRGTVTVEVAYAERDRQALVELVLPAGATVVEAIEASGLRTEFPKLEIDPERVGIFGRKVPLEQLLREGDRVEIYRPLLADPKEVRRERAAAAKNRGQGENPGGGPGRDVSGGPGG